MKERKAYLRELKKDRDQALKFKGLKDKVDSYKGTYLDIKIQFRSGEKGDYNDRVGNIQNKIKITRRIKKIPKMKRILVKIYQLKHLKII